MMDMSRLTHNVSVDAVTGDQLRRRHRQQQAQSQYQQGHYYYTSTLTLRSSVREDTGAYICSATSNHGFVESRVFLYVTQSGQLMPPL